MIRPYYMKRARDCAYIVKVLNELNVSSLLIKREIFLRRAWLDFK
jgi:hypothetical protein